MTTPATEPTRLIVAPWARLEDLPESRPQVHDLDYDELLWQASEMLYHLTGRQWAGQADRKIGLEPYRAGRCWTQTEQMAAASWPAAGPLFQAVERRQAWGVVQLPDPPVVAVDEVRIDDVPVTEGWWPQLPVGLLHRTSGTWPAEGLTVRYRHGLAPPAGGKQSAILLTVELGKAWAGDKACRLPQRIQTITREGVTIAMQDRWEHLDKGRLGIPEIDPWITSVNPKGLQQRARVWTPDTAGRRRS